MKGMIFAAGLGTRLRPLTNDRPKALVEVGGKPMLRRVIERFKQAGITEIVVNVHHFADKIIEYLCDNNNFGVTIHVSDERDYLLDTGGAILKARQWLDGNEPFMVHNADILTDLDLTALERTHIDSGAAATLVVAHRKTSRYLLLDADLSLRGWTDVRTGEVLPDGVEPSCMEKMAFGGIHILSPDKIFNRLSNFSEDRKFSIIPFYVKNCREIKIRGYLSPTPYRWMDIGSPETLAKAEAIFSDYTS